MKKAYYREQALERIARDVITAYDPKLYYGPPTAIPIEDIIEAQGLVLEYQYLRNNGRVLGETIFDDGLTAIYDWENHRYDLLPVKGGTILIDCSLCEEEASTGRLRFTCAHELGHWLLHKKQFSGTGENAALRSGDESDNTLEVQANLLGSNVIIITDIADHYFLSIACVFCFSKIFKFYYGDSAYQSRICFFLNIHCAFKTIPNNGIITINIKSCLIIRNSLIKSRKNMNTMLLSCIFCIG